MGESTALADLIRRARRRQAFLLGLHASAGGLAVLLTGFAVLLVTGWGPFRWAPLLVVLLGAAAFAASRARKGIGSAYQTAQKLDRRLNLNDSLSTALYFKDTSGAVVEHQRNEAERTARTVEPRYAFPSIAPKAFYVSGALAFVGVSLFFVRYGVTRQLDLSAPIVHLGFDDGTTDGAKDALHRKVLAEASRKKPDPVTGELLAPWQTNTLDNQPAPDNVLDAVGEPDVENTSTAKDAATKSKASEMKNEVPGQTQGDGSTKADTTANPDGDSPSADGKEAQQSSPQQQGSQQNSSQDQSNKAGIMDRVRDAMADLMSKLMPAPQSGDRKSSESRSGSQAGAQRQASSNTQSASNTDQGAPEANAQGEAGPPQSGQKMEASRGRAGDSTPHNDSPDAKSGIGSQDGDKEAKYADQLAAMGKISELIGKRSANVTGEVMVEVASGKQQLKTQYSNRKASHVDAGGEIDRDEVPLAYQQYVQQYFEEIRKTPTPHRTAHSGSTGVAE